MILREVKDESNKDDDVRKKCYIVEKSFFFLVCLLKVGYGNNWKLYRR